MAISYLNCITMLFVLVLLSTAYSMLVKANDNVKHYLMDNNGPESDLVSSILSRGYVPNEKYLPKPFLLKNTDNDVTYLLSKLSDEELIRLLNEQPKKAVYDLKDILRLALSSKFEDALKNTNKLNFKDRRPLKLLSNYENQGEEKTRFWKIPNREDSDETPFFRLENKPVNLYSTTDNNYEAILKLNKILNSHQLYSENNGITSEDDEKNELLFDMLVAQLKKLCCKKSSHSNLNMNKFRTVNSFLSLTSGNTDSQNLAAMNEHMFLILNDDIKTNSSDEIISVDPDSLGKNSSVLLLGPITTPLTDSQLKLVMNRLSNELSKSEYLPLLHDLSRGSLSARNAALMKSLVTGPETRRYIKPHRCNHRSKLARVYGGPKWLICTGYLNLNTPSLYD